MASSPGEVKGWRLAAWLLGFGVFGIHFVSERHRHQRALGVAVRVALAVALGAFGLAVFGPVRTHWGESSQLRLAAFSLIAWPLLTGLPAFLLALLGGRVLDQMHARAQGGAPAAEVGE
jgi:hypothetical protein